MGLYRNTTHGSSMIGLFPGGSKQTWTASDLIVQSWSSWHKPQPLTTLPKLLRRQACLDAGFWPDGHAARPKLCRNMQSWHADQRDGEGLKTFLTYSMV
jgi:hypothetical protein